MFVTVHLDIINLIIRSERPYSTFLIFQFLTERQHSPPIQPPYFLHCKSCESLPFVPCCLYIALWSRGNRTSCHCMPVYGWYDNTAPFDLIIYFCLLKKINQQFVFMRRKGVRNKQLNKKILHTSGSAKHTFEI